MASLQNSAQVIKNANELPTPPNPTRRTAPVLPPLPRNTPTPGQYMPYNNGYNFGQFNNSMMMPYQSPLYNNYGYNNYRMYGQPNYSDEAERRFIQFAENSSRNTFANVESIVRAVNSISTMLDNTFFAMTSSFRAVLSVAENFGRLRSMFGHIWYSINIFRLFNWLYKKLMSLVGIKVARSATSIAWNQAVTDAPSTPPSPNGPSPPPGSSWPTLAFLGVLISAPYIISKFLPKYEDKSDPNNWKAPPIKAKAAFDFIARNSNELTVKTNDIVMVAPPYVQNEMNLINSDWAFASCNGQTGIVPLNYLLNIENQKSVPVAKKLNSSNNNNSVKTHTKRVSFGENQVFENVDLEDYVTGKKVVKSMDDSKKDEHLINKEKKLVPESNEAKLTNNEQNSESNN